MRLCSCVPARVRVRAHLEVDVVGKEEKPGPCALAGAEAEDLWHVLSAKGRVRHDHVMFRDCSVLHHLDKTTRSKREW